MPSYPSRIRRRPWHRKWEYRAASKGKSRTPQPRDSTSRQRIGRATTLLAGIAEQVPQAREDVLILIFDPSWTFRTTFWLFGGTSVRLENSLNYLYETTNTHAALCYPNTPTSGEQQETCSLTSSQVILLRNGTVYATYPYDKVVALTYDGWTETVSLLTTIPIEYMSPPSEIETYNPRALTTPGDLPPPRVSSLFTRWPDNDPIERPIQRSVSEQFDKPITGLGWSEPQPGGSMWMVNPQAELSYVLRPGTAYGISFKATALAPDMIASLVLRVNDEPISLTKHIDGYFYVFEGTIPQAVMARSPTRTRLVFETDRAMSPQSLGINNDSRILALLFQWLKIEPISATPNSR